MQASAQQTPSTQKALLHSVPAAQGEPSDLGPQLPFWQNSPLTQSMSLLQRGRQAPSLQR